MVKHNNVIPNQHFHKDWQNRVKVTLDQPAKKARCVPPRPPRSFFPLTRPPPPPPLASDDDASRRAIKSRPIAISVGGG